MLFWKVICMFGVSFIAYWVVLHNSNTLEYVSVVAALPAPFREDFLWLISSSLFNNMARVVVHTVENFYAGITE